MTRRAVLLAAILLVLASTMRTAASVQQEQEEDTSSPALRIGWEEFRKLYDARSVDVIDVRGLVFFESGHIPGARSIPLEEIEKHAAELRRSKKPLVLYCA